MDVTIKKELESLNGSITPAELSRGYNISTRHAFVILLSMVFIGKMKMTIRGFRGV